jgi:DNA-binding transcriptional MerR regulator
MVRKLLTYNYGRCYTSEAKTEYGRIQITTSQLQISEVARRAKVSIRTVRYYEEKGLLPPSSYTSGGIRLYNEQDVNRLIFIRRLKILGFSIEEIKMCLGNVTEFSDRRVRIKHTLELLRMQKKKSQEQKAQLASLEKEIDASLDKVTKCLDCKAEQCSELCPDFGNIL